MGLANQGSFKKPMEQCRLQAFGVDAEGHYQPSFLEKKSHTTSPNPRKRIPKVDKGELKGDSKNYKCGGGLHHIAGKKGQWEQV